MSILHALQGLRPGARGPSAPAVMEVTYLVIDTVEPLDPAGPDIVDVSDSRIECDSSYSHPATVAQMARVLNHGENVCSVPRFGGDYIPEEGTDQHRCG